MKRAGEQVINAVAYSHCFGLVCMRLRDSLIAPPSRPGSYAIVKSVASHILNGRSTIASNPGLPRPDFISQPWRKIKIHGCEIKSGRGRPGLEARPVMPILKHKLNVICHTRCYVPSLPYCPCSNSLSSCHPAL